MPRNPRLDILTISLAYLAFIGIGMSSGLLGVAWTSMQVEFGLPLDALGFMLTASTIGYLTASFGSGMLAHRFGIGRMLVLAGVLMIVGLLAAVLSPNFWLLVALTLLTGTGSGILDAGLNGYVAQHHSDRAMNWLHAAFGVGVTITPLIFAQIFSAQLSWRVGYGAVLGFIAVLTVVFLFARGSWRSQLLHSDGVPAKRRRVIDVLRMPVVLMGILMFFLYAGLEATPGQLGLVLFTQGRGLSEEIASLWVGYYWASFTIGRIFFGAIITRVNTLLLFRLCVLATLLGALLLMWNPSPEAGLIGLLVLGFAQAPLFPMMISNTPGRVGAASANDAIGFQIAGAGIGIAALPSFAAVLANNPNLSVEIIPVFIVVAAVLVIVLHEISVMQGARARQRVEAAAAGD